jgi:NAD(P)-dependent dehydrogenase (short-subunit alcohol dehydrogenase family)
MACCCCGLFFVLLAVGAVLAFIRWLMASTLKTANIQGKTVLITGCDTGFGRGTTVQLAGKGVKVLAACLTQEAVDELNKVKNVVAFQMDVTKKESIEQSFAGVVNTHCGKEGLWAVINNAGILRAGDLELMPIEQWRQQFEVNVFGMVQVIQKCIPLVRKTGGRIINIASVAGRYSGARSSAYNATKYSVEALSDALRVEMKPFGVSVVIIEPGVMLTNLWDQPTKLAENAFNSITKEQQEIYGKDYFLNFNTAMQKFIKKVNGNPQRVINNLDNAVTSRWPLHRYTIGNDIPLWLTLSVLPSCVTDWMNLKDNEKAGVVPAYVKRSRK